MFDGPTLVVTVENWLAIESTCTLPIAVRTLADARTWSLAPGPTNRVVIATADEILTDQETSAITVQFLVSA